MNLNCTAKNGNSVQDGDFEVKVTKKSDRKTTTYYAGNTDSTGNLHLSHQTAYLAEDASFATELTLIATSSFADGDTIEVKYWPKQNASEGSPFTAVHTAVGRSLSMRRTALFPSSNQF